VSEGTFYSVLTTIQAPTECARRLADCLGRHGATLVVAGDKKGPEAFDLPGTEFLSLEAQLASPFRLAKLLPTGHYARKNVAYLHAIRLGAKCIYETDDDNAPNDAWAPRSRTAPARRVTPRPWLNVYRLFTDELIWPRGFPLTRVSDPATWQQEGVDPREVSSPIQQGLADLSPDVDAVWRLLLDREFRFRSAESVWLPPDTWCPFNSQSTWWWAEAFPLLYLPSFCSFRMTDIWRSFIAQRCLWELGAGVVFHAAEVEQERNIHSLMRDFEDEIPGYLGNERLVKTLSVLSLTSGPGGVLGNLRQCYDALINAEFFPQQEAQLVDAWIRDISGCT
jgi:hypothetical protein